ncbi:Arginine biosynthesis bifunctional protein ArgJ beta chain [Nadsonia fulvescens var. elongata DSM 6958]|uniref:Arginine biosynthesis bifunctional protein ArgJ, mitochondrial n=1 Tax=Nadsonia fulvescens var. elongata DSM 6958 TaxID=857566 RepID=A0A1E3PKI2_9ASCO|nr:Arginine biosynthesis bifunctional protein ArgJ beta chain [Nadsonia fulvescens var. elongata DSM 6958]
MSVKSAVLRVVPASLATSRPFSTRSFAQAADKSRFVPTSGTYPQGFKVGGMHCGVKKNADVLDLALLVSETACNAAAVFTTNAFKAAPVVVSKAVIDASKGQGIQSIVVNSGCANAVTGEGGLADARAMVAVTDEVVHQGKSESQAGQTLVMSTGVIGQRLPIENILNGISTLYQQLGSDHKAWLNCAKGICTTDTFPKLVSKQFELNGINYSIAGLAKGAGMIHPNMATLLGFFVTDAPVSSGALRRALQFAVARSFNSISVDGDCSTNDTIAALANGAAGGELITETSAGYSVFEGIMTEFSEDLAKLVVRDGEGATKFVTITVEDALSFEDAKQVASTIATSPLVKTAFYGKDANWGRILCATGYAGVPVEPTKTNVSFLPTDNSPELKLLVNGEPEKVDEARASEILDMEDLEVRVQLGTGGGYSARYYTCDFSHEYVTINGDYRT